MRGKDKKPRKRTRIYTSVPAEIRFWIHVDKYSSDCWLWTGAKSPNGYGRFRPGPKDVPMVGPHRFSYELHYGAIPDGLVVMHSCDNPACVKPSHLSVGTNKDNTHDAMRKGRMKHYFASGPDVRRGDQAKKLSPEKVREIRSSSETRRELAQKFGVDRSIIDRIQTFKAWRNV